MTRGAGVRTLRLDAGPVNLLGPTSVAEPRRAVHEASADPATQVIALVDRRDALSTGLDEKALRAGGAPARYGPREAQEVGFLDRIVPEASLEEELAREARALVELPRRGLRCHPAHRARCGPRPHARIGARAGPRSKSSGGVPA
jgi:enoyl-CoA hydratase/carnithine racemase